MKNSIDTIKNGIRDLPTCSAVPQPTAPPRVPDVLHIIYIKYKQMPVFNFIFDLLWLDKFCNFFEVL
jgi:hypothetical protein